MAEGRFLVYFTNLSNVQYITKEHILDVQLSFKKMKKNAFLFYAFLVHFVIKKSDSSSSKTD